MLEPEGITFIGSTSADVQRGAVLLDPRAERIEVDRIVCLPLLDGPAIPGVPADADGFIPVDAHGRVPGTPDVYAAGDATTFPIKQGGLACQQADAVAELISATAGAPIEPIPFRPVLRGKLMTGGRDRFLRQQPRRRRAPRRGLRAAAVVAADQGRRALSLPIPPRERRPHRTSPSRSRSTTAREPAKRLTKPSRKSRRRRK